MRIVDTVLADFQDELNEQLSVEVLPVSEKEMNKKFKKLELKYKTKLR